MVATAESQAQAARLQESSRPGRYHMGYVRGKVPFWHHHPKLSLIAPADLKTPPDKMKYNAGACCSIYVYYAFLVHFRAILTENDGNLGWMDGQDFG